MWNIYHELQMNITRDQQKDIQSKPVAENTIKEFLIKKSFR